MAKRKVATRKKPVRTVIRKEVVEKVVEPIILYIGRFTTHCGECNGPVPDRGAKTCPNCGARFTHVDTTCTLPWMKDIIKVHRPDLLVV